VYFDLNEHTFYTYIPKVNEVKSDRLITIIRHSFIEAIKNMSKNNETIQLEWK